MGSVLERETRLFQERLPDLLEKHEGDYAVVFEDLVIGAFADEDEAIRAGLTKCGAQPFLVRQILRQERPVIVATNLVEPPTG